MTPSIRPSTSLAKSPDYLINIDDINATLQTGDPTDDTVEIIENKNLENKSKHVRPEDTPEAKARFAFLQQCKPFADKPGYSYRIATIVQPILTGICIVSSITLGIAAAFNNKPTSEISFGIQATALYTAVASLSAMFGHSYYYYWKIPYEQQQQEGWNLFQGPHRYPVTKPTKKLATFAPHEV